MRWPCGLSFGMTSPQRSHRIMRRSVDQETGARVDGGGVAPLLNVEDARGVACLDAHDLEADERVAGAPFAKCGKGLEGGFAVGGEQAIGVGEGVCVGGRQLVGVDKLV